MTQSTIDNATGKVNPPQETPTPHELGEDIHLERVGNVPHSPPAGGAGGMVPPSLSLSDNSTEVTNEGGRKKGRSPSQVAKSKEVLRRNVQAAVEQYGLDFCAVATYTFAEHLDWRNQSDWAEAKRRWNSFLTHQVRSLFRGGVGVWEPQKSGRIHVHSVVGIKGAHSIREGVDFAAFKVRDYRTAPPELKRLWAILRDVCPRYGFGRHELIPIQSPEGFGFYVGKYLGKVHGDDRWQQDFKARRTTTFGDFSRVAWQSMGWVKSSHRDMMRELVHQGMSPDPELLKAKLGTRWPLRLWRAVEAAREEIEWLKPDELEPRNYQAAACAETVRRLYLGTVAPWPTANEQREPEPSVNAADRELVDRVLALFGGRVVAEWEA